ncbi:MAG: VTT domain-containing protein [Candidatus Thermoplasmatota archaeon]|nr:VTT domain-containing protein [Candidatus Thermoplasmatota archaeon]
MGDKKSIKNALLNKKNNLMNVKKERPIFFIWKFIIGIMIIIFSLIVGYQLFTNTESISQLIQDSGNMGPLVYLCILSIAIVMLFPTPILKIFTGTFFGFSLGLLINFLASMIGGLLAFFIGRYFFRDTVSKIIIKNKITKDLENSLEKEGFKISFLIRLSPLIPDEWLNYVLSISPISTKTFILSNSSSIVYSLIYAYYGAILGRVVFSQKGLLEVDYTIIDWFLMILGIIATIISIIIVTNISKKAFENATFESE